MQHLVCKLLVGHFIVEVMCQIIPRIPKAISSGVQDDRMTVCATKSEMKRRLRGSSLQIVMAVTQLVDLTIVLV